MGCCGLVVGLGSWSSPFKWNPKNPKQRVTYKKDKSFNRNAHCSQPHPNPDVSRCLILQDFLTTVQGWAIFAEKVCFFEIYLLFLCSSSLSHFGFIFFFPSIVSVLVLDLCAVANCLWVMMCALLTFFTTMWFKSPI